MVDIGGSELMMDRPIQPPKLRNVSYASTGGCVRSADGSTVVLRDLEDGPLTSIDNVLSRALISFTRHPRGPDVAGPAWKTRLPQSRVQPAPRTTQVQGSDVCFVRSEL